MPNLSDELKIVISGDPKKFENALDRVQQETERLEAGLSAAAKISGVAFAALTGTVFGLVAAFREQEIQEKKTAQLLENTGNVAGMSAKQIFEYASALQETSIYGDEVILESQNLLISMAKLSEEGFKRASQTALDLAATMGGDLQGATAALGKALADPTQGIAALGRQGIKFSEEQKRMITALDQTGQRAKAQEIILDALEKKVGGMAKTQAEGTGRTIQLKNAISDLAEELGRRLTPKIDKAAQAIIPFFQWFTKQDDILNTVSALITMSTVVAGIATVISVASLAIVKYNAYVKAAELSNWALTFSFKAMLGAAGIGLVIIAITDLAVNWERRTLQMKAAWTAFVTFVQQGASSLNDILYGIATGNLDKIKAGFQSLGTSAKNFVDNYSTTVDAGMKAIEEREKASQETRKTNEETGNANRLTALTVFLEKKKALEDEYAKLSAEAQMTENQNEILMKQEQQNQLLELNAAYRQAILESRVTDEQLDVEQELAFQTQMQELRNEARAQEMNAHRAVQLEKAQVQAKADLQYLKDREKFGVAYAKINKAINSEHVQGAAQASGELVALQQSTNATLKSIGKAAAIADITIKTAQSAMNIYNGFSTIPIIGPALGVAGAVAAVAFGAERIRQVTAAADGGMITGGVAGKDSVPAMLMPGELVTPTRNFDEVVNAVAQSRLQDQGLASATSGGRMHVTFGWEDDAFRVIRAKIDEMDALGV